MNAALHKLAIPTDLVATMTALHRAGFALLPLGRGADGKKSILQFKDRDVTLRQVFGAMAGRNSTMFAVRLGGLVGLDIDEDDEALAADLEARFGPAAVHVATSRGRHLWYRAPIGLLPELRSEGLPVDVKSGHNAYLVAPGSVKPDGTPYRLIKGDLTRDRLTVLRIEGLRPIAQPRSIGHSPELGTEGNRHNDLLGAALAAVRNVHSEAELLTHLTSTRDGFYRPETLPDTEVAGIATWAWAKRLGNSLWGGRDSGVPVNRLAIDALLAGRPNRDSALGLYTTLLAIHGHLPGATFPLAWQAMRLSGHTGLSEDAFRNARRALESAGLLRCAKGHVAGKAPALFQLALPRSS